MARVGMKRAQPHEWLGPLGYEHVENEANTKKIRREEDPEDPTTCNMRRCMDDGGPSNSEYLFQVRCAMRSMEAFLAPSLRRIIGGPSPFELAKSERFVEQTTGTIQQRHKIRACSCSMQMAASNKTNARLRSKCSQRGQPCTSLWLLLLLLRARFSKSVSPLSFPDASTNPRLFTSLYQHAAATPADTAAVSHRTSTGRARVVVEETEYEVGFMLDIEGKLAKKEHDNSQTQCADLQLAWSEPPSSETSKLHPQPTWSTDSGNDNTPSPYSYSYGADKDRKTEQRFTSTGTTIVGVSGPDFCILAADSRATAGSMVADKSCFKLHPLSSNCAAAGAGTSADLDHVTRECCYAARLMQQNELHGNDERTIQTGSTASAASPPISVHQLCRYMLDRLYKQGGACQANLIVGGVYKGKSVLRAIHPHGSMDVVSYTALGSGGLAAMGVLESHYNSSSKKSSNGTMTIDEAIVLATEAVKAGIDHDMGSGSQVDICVIGPAGVAMYTRRIVPEDTLHSLPS